MEVKDLMKPRYKIISRWPNCPWKLGRVLIHIGNGDYDCVEAPTIGGLRDPEEYPCNLKKLEWYEERKPEEMPEYVKCIATPDQRIMPGMVLAVNWSVNDHTWGLAKGHHIFPYTKCYLPATREEYERYKQKEATNE